MNGEHLTDQEAQEFAMADNNSDSTAALHINICAECMAKVHSYQVLFTELKQQPVPAFDFDLEQLVMQQLQPIKQAKDHVRNWLIAVGLFFSGSIIYVFRDYLVVEKGLLVFLTIICAVPILLFLFAETFRNYQKKMQLLEI